MTLSLPALDQVVQDQHLSQQGECLLPGESLFIEKRDMRLLALWSCGLLYYLSLTHPGVSRCPLFSIPIVAFLFNARFRIRLVISTGLVLC